MPLSGGQKLGAVTNLTPLLGVAREQANPAHGLNEVRPHRSLNYLTAELMGALAADRKQGDDHMDDKRSNAPQAPSLSIRTVTDRLAQFLWSREPHRHLTIEITITNHHTGEAPDVSFELLVPESMVFNLSGDAWNPMYKRVVHETVYDVWQTLGGGIGRYEGGTRGGVTLTRPGARWKQKLTVNLKPDLSSVELLWRLYERTVPIGDYGRTKITFAKTFPSFRSRTTDPSLRE